MEWIDEIIMLNSVEHDKKLFGDDNDAFTVNDSKTEAAKSCFGEVLSMEDSDGDDEASEASEGLVS